MEESLTTRSRTRNFFLACLQLAWLLETATCFVPISPQVNLPRRSLASFAQTKASQSTGFQFLGNSVYSEVFQSKDTKKDTKKPVVLLIHGFGCSTFYWRETVRQLTEIGGYTVHAIDLLGQGKSSKPIRTDGIEYSINLWAEQVDQYAQQRLPPGKDVVLIGNSLGSLVALAAATADFQGTDPYDAYLRQHTKGIGFFNCGIGMNSRNILKEFTGIQRAVLEAIFDVFDFLIFKNIPLLTFVVEKLVTKESLQNALSGLYQYAEDERVDDDLVDSFYKPAQDPASPEVISQIYTNDPGATPMEIYQRHQSFLESSVAIHAVWGKQDAITPLTGSVGQYFLARSRENGNVSIDIVDGAGHILFDEVPSSNELMLQWLNRL